MSAAAARSAAAEGGIFHESQALYHERDQLPVAVLQHVDDDSHAESRPGRDPFQRARIRLGGDPVDRVFALHFGQLIVQLFTHLGGDGLEFQRGIVDSQARRRDVPRPCSRRSRLHVPGAPYRRVSLRAVPYGSV